MPCSGVVSTLPDVFNLDVVPDSGSVHRLTIVAYDGCSHFEESVDLDDSASKSVIRLIVRIHAGPRSCPRLARWLYRFNASASLSPGHVIGAVDVIDPSPGKRRTCAMIVR